MSLQFSLEANNLQMAIMRFVCEWVKVKKTPIPQKEIVEQMKQEGVKDFTTINALTGLVKKGYIRRSFTISNRTSYVQIRSI